MPLRADEIEEVQAIVDAAIKAALTPVATPENKVKPVEPEMKVDPAVKDEPPKKVAPLKSVADKGGKK